MNAPLMKVEGLTSHYGRIQALYGIDVEIYQGELVVLVGANGAGKTTLLRAISGVQPISGGSISFEGENIDSLPGATRVKRGISQVPEGRQMFGPMSVEDNLKLGSYIRAMKGIDEDMEAMYTMFPILKTKRKLASGNLSGGQQQMLAIARALMARPSLLLLDEPSMGLAPNLVEEIFEKIVELKNSGTTVFLVEQNAFAALKIADRGYVLETGRTILTDDADKLLTNKQVKEAYLGF